MKLGGFGDTGQRSLVQLKPDPLGSLAAARTKMTYNGYEIVPYVRELAGDDGWTVEFLIERHDDSGRGIKKFATSEVRPSEDEAVARCEELACRVIDGALPGCTVEDLHLDV